MLDKIKDFLTTYKTNIITTAVIILVGLVVIIVLHVITKQVAKKAVNKRALATALLLKKIFNYIFVLILILVVLNLWGFDIKVLLWSLAGIAILIGISSYKLIHDILCGIVIVFGNYYERDEIVEINGFKGRIVAIRTRSTHLVNTKGELKIIAHGKIEELINYSRHYSVAELKLLVSFKAPIEQIILSLQEKLSSLVEIYPQIIEGPNVIGLSDFKKEGLEISVVAKTLSEQHYEVERALKKTVSEIFKERGFELAKEEVVVINER